MSDKKLAEKSNSKRIRLDPNGLTGLTSEMTVLVKPT